MINSANIFLLIISVIWIIFGLQIIIFRKKLVEAHKMYASKRKGYIYDRIKYEPKINSQAVAIIVGIGFIIISILQITRLLEVY